MRYLILLVLAALPALPQCGPAAVRKPIGNGQYSCVPKATVVQRTGTLTSGKVPAVDASGNLVDSPMSCTGGNCSIAPTLPGALTGGTVGAWGKYTVTYQASAFLTAATSVSIPFGELPANGVVEAVRIKHSVAFAGTGVTSTTCSLGDGTDHTAYADPFNVFQAVSNTAQYWDGGAYSTTAAAHTLTLRCTANTNFGTGAATVLTAGSVTVWIKTAVLQ